MADLLKAAKDPKFREDVIRGLGETFSRGVAGVLGAPVDLTTMAMRPFGYNVPAEQVVGGSEYIGRQMEEAGLISSARNPVAEFLAGVAIPDPMDAAKLGAMFIGPIARVWDADAAARAAKMEAEGFDPRTIWSETGTWRGPDNKWRQEIPDNELKKIYNTEEIFDPRKFYQDEAQRISNLQEKIGKEFNAGKIPKDDAWAEYNRLKGLKEEALKKAEQYYSPGLMISRVGEDIPFEQVFQHEQLQRAYDQLPTVAFTKNLPFEGAGSYSKGRIQTSLLNNPPESVMAHELQHAIQQREGFAGGGNPEQFENINNSITSLADQAKTYDVAYLLKEKMQNGMSLADAKKAYFDETGIKAPEGAASIARYNSFESIANNKRDVVLRINELSDIAQYSPYEAYRRLAGEAEARATEARLGMTAAERRAKFPEESYDVPLSELIIRDQPIGRSMSTRQAPRDEAMRIAQANAAKPVSEGGLGLPPDNTAMDRAKAMGFDTPAFHATGADFEAFNPLAYRKASFFSGTPEGAMRGRAAGQGDLTASGKNENIIPVMLRSESVEGLSFTPKEKEILSDYKGALSENKVNEAMEKIGKGSWYNYFDEIELPSGEFVYQAKSGSKPYQEVKRTGRDVYGSSLSDYDTASAERFAADYAKTRGMKGFMQRDEGGLSIAVTEPSEIRSRFAAFDPAKRYESDLLGAADPRLLAGVAGATGAGLYGASRMQEGEERPQPRFGFRPDGTPKGEGWLGVLPLADGNLATEYSMQSQAVKVGDQMVDFPTLVPTLSREEVNLMLSDIIPNRKPIPEPIVQKAIKHAKDRLDKGLSPFKELGE